MKTKLWCCVGSSFKEPTYAYDSLSYNRSVSIEKHIKGGSWGWDQWKSKGWKCIKVEVEIKPINEVK